MNKKGKIEVMIPDKYLKCDIFNQMDDLLTAALKYLKDQNKKCEFMGFNAANGHVVLIDGIKYYTSGNTASYADASSRIKFFVVDSEEHDYVENRFKERENLIAENLKN